VLEKNKYNFTSYLLCKDFIQEVGSLLI